MSGKTKLLKRVRTQGFAKLADFYISYSFHVDSHGDNRFLKIDYGSP